MADFVENPPLGAAHIPILLSEVEQEQKPSGNGDREAIVVGVGLCDGEGERSVRLCSNCLGLMDLDLTVRSNFKI